MSDFSFLKKYIFLEQDENAKGSKHSFFRLPENDIINSEKRMGFSFPKELRDFYSQIGYGFLCNNDKKMLDRIMDPGSVADFHLKEGIFETDPDVCIYENKGRLVFFEVCEGTYLVLDLNSKSKEGTSPIYLFDTLVANSLIEFIKQMEKETDYYMKL